MTMHEVAGANNEVRRLRGRVSDRQGDRKDIDTLMALPLRLVERTGRSIAPHLKSKDEVNLTQVFH